MKKYLICIAVLASALFPRQMHAQDDGNTLEPGRPLWQQVNPDAANYLTNRHALVGRGCVANKLVTVVGVGSWIEDLDNLTDEDLNNYTAFPKIVGAGIGINPIVSVRDMNNYYAAGTEAGFCVVASSGSSVLSLEVIATMDIYFYRDGQEMGRKDVEEGLSAGGIGLSLISVPGTDDANIYLTATSDWDFDEVCLVDGGGVALDVGSTWLVKYAFVGKEKEIKLTDGGLASMGPDYYFDSAEGWNPVLLGIPFPLLSDQIENLTNDDYDSDYATLTPIIAAGYQGGVKLCVGNSGDEEVFKAGSEVGFKYKAGNLLALNVGAWIDIVLFDRNGDEVQRETVSGGVLGLSVAGGENGMASIVSSVDYSGAEIRFHTVLSVNVGAMGVYYGFVREAPDVNHHCDINPTFDTNLCEAQTSIQLESNPALSVTWSLESAPDGSKVTVTDGGYVSNMDTNGDYIFRATASDGCFETVVINKGEVIGSAADNICGQPLVNLDEAIEGPYALTDDLHGTSGSLLSLTDSENVDYILDDDYNNCATYISGLSVANNLMIVGVKTTDGSLIYDAATAQYPAKLGFMVELESEGLDVSALQFFLIRGYHEGNQVFEKVITETDVVSVGLAGDNRQQKMRFCVEVDPTMKDSNGEPIKVDEIMLWKAGVLNLTVSTLNIYYPFKEILNPENEDCGGPFGCGVQIISAEPGGSGASISTGEQGSVVSVAGVNDKLSFFIDGDLETAMAVVNSVTVGGGTVFSVKPGYTLDFRHQLCIVVDNNTYLAGVSAGKWLTVRTYYQGNPTGDEFTNWNVLGVNVIGYGDKSILILQPKARYDEVQIEVASVAGVLDFQYFYGMFLRGDTDGDGIPDCEDPESCFTSIGDLEVSQICQGNEMTISGKGLAGTKYFLSMPEQGIVEQELPVDREGYFTVTYTLNTVGRFNMIFYDGSHNIVDTAPYAVHPLYTEWKADPVNTDWNEWNNWTAGSPYCCTDVVITSDAAKYPLLSVDVAEADEYCCDRIYFQSRAAVDCPASLNYSKAWVEMELDPNRYYLLSAPLKNMYTGDMFVPADEGNPDYFTDFTAENMPQNRFNPRVYQRLWATTAPARLFDGATTQVGIDAEADLGHAEINKAEWSKNFNALNYLYPMANGFSLWVDNQALSGDHKFVFRFPKLHTSYNYYSDYDGEMLAASENLDKTDAGRFIYEQEAEESTLLTFDYEGEPRKVYTNVLPLAVTLRTGTGTSTADFLVGNPFMSRIDIAAFIAGNEGVESVKVYDGNTVHSVSRDLLSNAEGVTRIEPMQSFFVTFESASAEKEILFTEEMLTGESTLQSSAIPALRVLAGNGHAESGVLLAGIGGVDAVASLMDAEVKPSVGVFAVSGSVAYDILSIEGMAEVPLAICTAEADTLVLRFVEENGFDSSRYVLRDNSTGDAYALDEEIILAPGESSIGKYSLVDVALWKEEGAGSEVFVTTQGTDATVKTVGSEIVGITVYGMDGRVYSSLKVHPSVEVQVRLQRDLQIVSVVLADGTKHNFKLMAY